MAKAANDSQSIRFYCARCRVALKVNVKLAGKYMNCPKCKQRTPIPNSQHEADEDARDYGVVQMAYEVPPNCMKCKKKMPKGSIICTNCGFDYREGKQMNIEDHTVKEGEPMRGKPALTYMIADILLILIGLVTFIVRLIMSDPPVWWEMGMYLSGTLLFIALLPMHIRQFVDYSQVPAREHDHKREEDRAERTEAAAPYGDNTALVVIGCIFLMMGTAFFIWSRDREGKLIIPFYNDQDRL